MSFMSGNTFEYKTLITFETAGKSKIKEVESSMDGLKTKSTEVSTGWDKATKTMFRSTSMLLFSTQMALFYYSMLISAGDSVKTTTLSLDEAQDDYNRTLMEYGYGSEQAVSAARRLEKAQIAVNRANQLATVSTIGMGLQLVNFGVQVVQALPHIRTLITTLKSLTIVQTIANAMSGPAGWAKLGAGLAIGAGSAIAVNSILNYEGGGSANMEDFERAQTERDRRERYDLIAASGTS